MKISSHHYWSLAAFAAFFIISIACSTGEDFPEVRELNIEMKRASDGFQFTNQDDFDFINLHLSLGKVDSIFKPSGAFHGIKSNRDYSSIVSELKINDSIILDFSDFISFPDSLSAVDTLKAYTVIASSDCPEEGSICNTLNVIQ